MRVFLFLLFTFSCYAFDQNAQEHIQKAVLSYPQVKQGRRVIEKKIYKFSLMSEDATKTTGAVVYSGINGEISTKHFKKINIKTFGGDLRPDLTYDIKHKEALGTFSINWSF